METETPERPDPGTKDSPEGVTSASGPPIVQAAVVCIERYVGHLPKRKRSIPRKFNDYDDTGASVTTEKYSQDDDYIPPPGAVALDVPTDSVVIRKRGRPRKLAKTVDLVQKRRRCRPPKAKVNPVPVSPPVGNKRRGRPPKKNVKAATASEPVGNRSRGRPRRGAVLSEKVFKCEVCPKSFSTRGNLKVHMLIHDDKKPFACDVKECIKLFRTNEALRRHKMSHIGLKLFKCVVCNQMFTSKQSLSEHNNIHTGLRPFPCPVCLKTFRQVSVLRKHLVTHTALKPYSCEVCSRKFTTKEYLFSHVKTHSGKRHSLCATCGKGFSHQTDLVRHQSVHTGDKNYACSICQAKFSDASSCRRHIKNHSGHKPYKCQVCDATFKRVGNLKSHLVAKHDVSDDVIIQQPEVVEQDNSVDQGIPRSPDQDEEEPPSIEVQIVSVDEEMLDRQRDLVSQLSTGDPTQCDLTRFEDCMLIPPNPTTPAGKVVKVDKEIVVVGSSVVEVLDTKSGQSDENLILLEYNTDKGQKRVEVQLAADVIQSDVIQSLERKQLADGGTKAGGPSGSILDDQQAASKDRESKETAEPSIADQTEQEQTEPNQTEPDQTSPPTEENSTDTGREEALPVDDASENETAEPDATDLTDSKFIASPDFESQEFYDWLAEFTQVCQTTQAPLTAEFFRNLSQVQKSVSDKLASPSGVLTQRENYRVLMDISQQLSAAATEHLNYIMLQIDTDIPATN